jgi:hypothetical protein
MLLKQPGSPGMPKNPQLPKPGAIADIPKGVAQGLQGLLKVRVPEPGKTTPLTVVQVVLVVIKASQ